MCLRFGESCRFIGDNLGFMKRLLTLAFIGCFAALTHAGAPPNIVWIVGEDMGPELGCYGDAQAITPNMDRLAREGTQFTHCFTQAPVCAPSRSGLITGQYPTTIGTHHMRSKLVSPPEMFTSRLQKAGYFVMWPGKTDFNFDVPKGAFDSTVDWTKTRKLPKQPFFAYINLGDSHESSIRMKDKYARFTENLTASEKHAPAKMSVPPYHPDAPEVRRDLANYYDLVTAVDKKVGDILELLETQGVASNTVVVLFGDHGRGLPRSKRWVYDSGIHVPLIVRWPGNLKPGTVSDDLVSFIDFAPTMLAVAGIEATASTSAMVEGVHTGVALYPPMQGTVFLGLMAQDRDYVFAARDRMDETYDRIRAVRDKQFKYIRNFEPQLPYAQKIAYMEEMPTMQVWRKWNAEGKLDEKQKLFFAPTKPLEELYDCEADPHEVHNLADSAKYQRKLRELRAVMDRWIKATHDMAATPEAELIKRGVVRDVSERYADRQKAD